tara:strand:+ start:4813 stop:6003 length:1191 start_codon:yes stop_codon:yes gene_type:complete
MSEDLAVDIAKQEINSGYLEFFELQIGVDSVSNNTTNILYFHDGKNDNSDDITYDGKTYIALPILLTGVEITGDGAIARPTITIANVESLIKAGSKFKTQMEDGTWNSKVDGEPVVASTFKLDDLVGSTLTRRKTLEKYLSSPTIEFPRDVYIVDRIQQKTNLFVTLELAAPFDLSGFRVPSRTVVGKYCGWQYQAARSEIIASDRRGACVWKQNNQINDGTSSYNLFVNEHDEPILQLSSLGTVNAWSNSTSYALDAFVTKNNIYYQSKAASNQGNDPEAGEVFWRIVRVYTTWSSGQSYTINTTDPKRNSIVLKDGLVWRATVAHTSTNDNAPEGGAAFWVRADTCGKLLQSCKLRYQAIGATTATGNAFIPSTELATKAILPFGAFPGTRKFR